MGDMAMAIKVMSTTPLKSLMNKVDKEVGHIFSVYPYVNGREKGFCISDERGWENHDSLAVAFSECRGSDSLVVYVGRSALYAYEQEDAKKKGKKHPVNFTIDRDAVMITDEIYYKHSYHVWCDKKKWYPKVGKAIADFLNLKINEDTLAKTLKQIDTDAKKEIRY